MAYVDFLTLSLLTSPSFQTTLELEMSLSVFIVTTAHCDNCCCCRFDTNRDRALMKMEKAFKEKSSCLEPNSKSSSSPLKNAQQSIPDLMMVDSGDEDDHHNHFNKTSSLVNNSKHKQTLKSPAQIKSKIPHSKSSENVSSSNNKSKKSSEDNRRPSILFGWGQSNNDTKEQLEVKGSSTGSNSKSKNAGVGASSNRFRR